MLLRIRKSDIIYKSNEHAPKIAAAWVNMNSLLIINELNELITVTAIGNMLLLF